MGGYVDKFPSFDGTNNHFITKEICPFCQESGSDKVDFCHICKGTGYIKCIENTRSNPEEEEAAMVDRLNNYNEGSGNG